MARKLLVSLAVLVGLVAVPAVPAFAASPNDPTNPMQFDSGGVIPIDDGANLTNDTTVTLQADLSDPDGGDQVELQVEVQLLGTPFLDTPTNEEADFHAQGTTSLQVTLSPDTYHWQARTADNTTAVSGWTPGGTFRINAPPSDPANLDQFESDGTTPIPRGGITNDPMVTFRADVADPDVGDNVKLQLEIQPTGTVFSDEFTHEQDTFHAQELASELQVTLAPGTYHWQARTADENGATSGWVRFGTLIVDDTVRVNAPPNNPTPLAQFTADLAHVAIAVGGKTHQRDVFLSAVVSDPDGSPPDSIQLQAEVRAVGTAFSGANATSDPVDSGETASVTYTDLAANTNYHWRVRAIDNNGGVSQWVSFGGNVDPSDTDFRVPQADLSVTKSVENLPPTVNVGQALRFNITVSNGGPDTATNITLTDALEALNTDPNNPAGYLDEAGATICAFNGSVCTASPVAYGGTFPVPDLASGASTMFQIQVVASTSDRNGFLTGKNAASAASADVFDANTANNTSAQVTYRINTVPNPPSNFFVFAGNGNAIASWEPPDKDGGLPLHDAYTLTYRIGAGPLTTVTVLASTTPKCTGNPSAICLNVVPLTNGQTYTFTVQAENDIGKSDPATTTVKPSTDSGAQIQPTNTAGSIVTGTTATTANPVVVTYTIPSGGGGIFAITDTQALPSGFCGGSPCIGPGTFNALPSVGYTSPSNPIQLMITWDVTVAGSAGVNTLIYIDKDGPGPKTSERVFTCAPKRGSAAPDPCVKSINVLGSKKVSPNANGDLQVQINMTSTFVAVDPIIGKG